MDSGQVLRTDIRLLASAGSMQVRCMGALFCCGYLACTMLVKSQTVRIPSGPRLIEMTKSDLFSSRNWNSTNVEIAGLRLGMSRIEASSAAHINGFRLMQSTPSELKWVPCSDYSSCFLVNSRRDRYEGVAVSFSETAAVASIKIEVDLEYESELLKRLPGETGRFINGGYSDDLRLRLLGPQTSSAMFRGRYGDKLKDTRYVYGDRGITVIVSPNVNLPPRTDGSRSVELTEVIFMSPR